MQNESNIILYEEKSFTRDMILVCSIGLNIGFIIGIMMLWIDHHMKKEHGKC